MPAQGQAAIDLDTFEKSEKMKEINNILQISCENGNAATIFAFEYLGTSRESIIIVTLLRKKGYSVEYGNNVIIVK